MEKVKEFLEFLFEKEQEAIYFSGYKEKLKEYNDVVRELNKSVYEKMPPLMRHHETPPHSERFYKEIKEFDEPIKPRHLYKISHYQNDTYGDLWACYVSVANPYMDTKRINDCYIVTEINEELKIIAKFGPDIDQPKWVFYGGDKELKMSALGKLFSVERYFEPSDDEWSLAQYHKEM